LQRFQTKIARLPKSLLTNVASPFPIMGCFSDDVASGIQMKQRLVWDDHQSHVLGIIPKGFEPRLGYSV
jgi:hypothetical protein